MKDLETHFQIGDTVRTTTEWNEEYTPIEGIITGFETLKDPKIEHVPVQDPRTGLFIYRERIIPNQYEYTEVVVLDNGEKIHANKLEKEE